MTSVPVGKERVLSTLNADGTRRWLRPRPSPGRYLNARKVVGYSLIVFFVGLPHVRIAGKPPILLDIASREFTFFGTTLYPTDTLLLALLLLTVFLSIFFLTALFGRVWCGWACPQTVYLELVYRPIERLLEGAPGRKAKAGAWRKPLRFAIFLLLSFGLANTFLAYFVGTDALSRWVLGSPLDHPGPFLLVVAVSVMMMFDFGFFREQLCIIACPYGRFQSVMLDRQSLIISYDPSRGEPRGKKKRSSRVRSTSDVSLKILSDGDQADPGTQQTGDCIDCGMCVTTCPTGIDIRDGLQLECINCAQCIDACDTVMDKVGRPRGLIRYGSQATILDGVKQRFVRPHTVLYPAIIVVLASVFIGLLITRQSAYVSVLRGPGAPFILQADGSVMSAARVKIQNRSDATVLYTLSIANAAGDIESTDQAITVGPGETADEPVALRLPRDVFEGGRFVADVRIAGSDGFEKIVGYPMRGPTNASSRSADERKQ
ncbi:MAG: cytochrome c oxidase accessory protein CcoG [Planctomycetota bacterium]